MRVRASRRAGSKAWLLILWGLSLAGSAWAGTPDYDAFCDRDGRILEDDAHAPAFQAMVRDPQQLEAIFEDAAKGNRRAARVFEALEKVYFPVVGREVAEREGRSACLAPLYRELSGTCIPNWGYLEYLPRDTEVGTRLRRAVADAYAKRARELGIQNQAIVSALSALGAVSIATAAASGELRAIRGVPGAGARAISQVDVDAIVRASRGVREAISALNAAGASQAEAIGALTQVLANSGRSVGAVVAGEGGSKILTGVVSGPNQPIVRVAADGAAKFGSATVALEVDTSGKVTAKVTNIRLP